MMTKNTADKKICPRCGSPKMKIWSDLTDEQKFLVEKLPFSAEFTPEQRKKHRFCQRCFFEDVLIETKNS